MRLRLTWALANPRKVEVAAVAALVAAGFAYTQVGKTFMPTMDEGDIIVSVEALPSVNLDQANRDERQASVGHPRERAGRHGHRRPHRLRRTRPRPDGARTRPTRSWS